MNQYKKELDHEKRITAIMCMVCLDYRLMRWKIEELLRHDYPTKKIMKIVKRYCEDRIEISQEDFATLCICAIRYCHGRKTYMPSLVMEIVGKHFAELSDKDIKIMYDDCRFMNPSDYGDEVIDKPDWLRWEKKLKEEMERREDGE